MTGSREPHEPSADHIGLERLCQFRAHRDRDFSLRQIFSDQIRELRRADRASTGTARAWDKLFAEAGLAENLLLRTKVESMRNGVLTIRVTDAPTRYAIERFLRAGGEAALARLAPTTLRRVKLML